MVDCFCQRPAVNRTSWTQNHPGRRFWACSRIVTDCGFFRWIDPPMCARSVQIIPGLLRSMNDHQERVNAMAAANARLKICLVCSWMLFLLFLMY
ncbi:zinc finger, GRF-type containing protein [Tanacetum coccineum]